MKIKNRGVPPNLVDTHRLPQTAVRRNYKMKQQGKKDTVEKDREKIGKCAEKTQAAEKPTGAKKLACCP